ncbi:MAG: dihydrofolate reductase family protein [Dehalococcoidia bacterium]
MTVPGEVLAGIQESEQQRGEKMRKLIASTYTTLDGVMNPVNWGELRSSEEDTKYSRDLLFDADLLLMGRATYEFFAEFWPSRTSADDAPGAPGMVDRINSMPKAVASTTLQGPLSWNATLIEGDVADGVAKLKQEPGQSIVMYGAGDLARTLMQHGLLDELRVLVHPVVWGSGEYIFRNKADVPPLKLIGTSVFNSGVVLLTYQPSSAGEGLG